MGLQLLVVFLAKLRKVTLMRVLPRTKEPDNKSEAVKQYAAAARHCLAFYILHSMRSHHGSIIFCSFICRQQLAGLVLAGICRTACRKGCGSAALRGRPQV